MNANRTADARAFEATGQFLADIAARSEPWPQLFSSWAEDRHPSAEVQRAVGIAIVRARVFGAVERQHGGAAK